MDYISILKNNDIESLKTYLKKHDADKEINGLSLLHWAVFMGNQEFTKTLIDNGADVNMKDELGRMPLEISSYFGFVEITEMLLIHKAKITSACIKRAKKGWDGKVQRDILNLFDKFGEHK